MTPDLTPEEQSKHLEIMGKIACDPLLSKAPASTKAVAVMCFVLLDEMKALHKQVQRLEGQKAKRGKK